MPAKSKQQFRFMEAVAHGQVKGVDPKVGQEFVNATPDPKHLPKTVKKDK